MSRPGKKRRGGHRESNGRLQRPSKEEREAARLRAEMGERATVAMQPHRQGNLDQLCASALGRHILHCGLRRELYDAGEEYAETTRRWRAAKGVPVGLTAVGVGSGAGPSPEAVARLQVRLIAMRGAVLKSGGSAVLSALDRVVLEDREQPGAVSSRVTAALLALAEHLGAVSVGAHPYR